MMIKLIEYIPENNAVGSTIIIDRDSISAAYTRYTSDWKYDTRENGKPDWSTRHEEYIDYTEIMLKNGHCFQVVSPVELIYELITDTRHQGEPHEMV